MSSGAVLQRAVQLLIERELLTNDEGHLITTSWNEAKLAHEHVRSHTEEEAREKQGNIKGVFMQHLIDRLGMARARAVVGLIRSQSLVKPPQIEAKVHAVQSPTITQQTHMMQSPLSPDPLLIQLPQMERSFGGPSSQEQQQATVATDEQQRVGSPTNLLPTPPPLKKQKKRTATPAVKASTGNTSAPSPQTVTEPIISPFDLENDIIPAEASEKNFDFNNIPTLDKELLQKEEDEMKALLRRFDISQPPAEMQPMELFSNSPNRESHNWEVHNVLTKEKATAIATTVLSQFGVKITKTALQLLSEGIQERLKHLLEEAVVYSRRRRNINALHNFTAISNSIQSMVVPAMAMKFGPDVRTVIGLEEHHAKRSLREALQQFDERATEELRTLDEDRAGRNKATASRDRSEGASSSLLWWERDEQREAEGALGWSELCAVHRKRDLARLHALGPFARKKPKTAEASSQQAQEAGGTDVSGSIGLPGELSSSGAGVGGVSGPLAMPVQSGRQFPLYTDERDRVSRDDVLAVLGRVAKPQAGGSYSQNIGDSCRKARLL